MLHVVTTGAYYPPVVNTWKILSILVNSGIIVHCTSAMANCIKLLVIVLCTLYCQLWGGYSGGL